jgi:type IX secretion system PorP/SprF family membrane protein
MNALKKIYLFIFLIFLISKSFLFGQHEPNYNQYMMNGFLINPAMAGVEGYTAINLTAREQWLGIKDGPRTHMISVQSRILKNSFISRKRSVRRRSRLSSRSGRVGYGGYIFNDRTGIIDRTGGQFTYTYHIKSRNIQYSGGLSLMMYQYRIAKEDIQLSDDLPDALLDGNKNTMWVPDAHIGFFMKHPDYYGGFAVKELFQSKVLQFGEYADEVSPLIRHYNIMGGYIHRINREWDFEPSLLFKFPEGQRMQMDVNTKFSYRDEYWGGVSFRTGSSLVFFGGVRFDKFYFGYAFDYTLRSIRKYTFGSHEFMVAIKFGDNARRYRWLNRF